MKKVLLYITIFGFTGCGGNFYTTSDLQKIISAAQQPAPSVLPSTLNTAATPAAQNIPTPTVAPAPAKTGDQLVDQINAYAKSHNIKGMTFNRKGDFAKLNVFDAYMLVRRGDNELTVVYQGQDQPECKSVVDFPKNFYDDECYVSKPDGQLDVVHP